MLQIKRPGVTKVVGMKEILVELAEKSYKVLIDNGAVNDCGKLISQAISADKLFLISNPTVYALYGQLVEQSLKNAGCQVLTGLMPDGEEYKNINEVMNLIDQAISWNLERSGAVVALGGGVVGDLAGFVAAIIYRGIEFVQMPTTLLAMVDSSVGGKVGINHTRGKNLLGAFYQPRLVIADPQTLKTLPEEEYLSGLGEVIKYGIIQDKEFFSYLEGHCDLILQKDPELLKKIIAKSCFNKSRIVSQDEKEHSLRMILNLGHTFGHAIEVLGQYQKYKHGQAVAVGIVMASFLAQKKGWLSSQERVRIENLIRNLGLGCNISDLDSNQVYLAMQTDKKVRNTKINYVLPFGIGNCRIADDIPEYWALEAIEYGKSF